jgi:hypothetical protein
MYDTTRIDCDPRSIRSPAAHSLRSYLHTIDSGDDERVGRLIFQVWEVLSNEEVARIVSGCSPRANAAKAVVDAARSKWKQQRKHKSVMIDDCACICHFFHGSPLNDHAANRIISQVSEEPRSANNNGSGLL